ncbi:MAG TPA: DUF924 family protein [Steroidobacteraceae bacterium]
MTVLIITTLLAVGFLSARAFGHAVFRPTAIAGEHLPVTDLQALAVVTFWIDAGPPLWFAKDVKFDTRFRERFLREHEAAARGELQHWLSTADGALALVILLDQFPRNAFRGTRRMYDTDGLAREAARTAFAAGYDQQIAVELRKFFVLPFAHSEDMADQDRSVALARRIGADDLGHAEHHRDIVRRFGRFPHRNAILGRDSTPAEQQYLANGGYAG